MLAAHQGIGEDLLFLDGYLAFLRVLRVLLFRRFVLTEGHEEHEGLQVESGSDYLSLHSADELLILFSAFE
jgi:hypothetical protein